MTIALPQLDGDNKLTHSRIGTYKACPRKHHYQYNLGIRRARQAHYFRTGGAVHKGLELRALGNSVAISIVGAVQTYDSLPDWCKSDEQIHGWMVERETVFNLLKGYFWYWEKGEHPDDISIAEFLETEVPFELPIKNPETGSASTVFRQGGKRDGIVKLVDGRLAVLEHKTTGDSIDPQADYWKRLEIDHQISMYFNAALVAGHDVQTVLYDVIRKPGIAPKKIPLVDDDDFKIVLDADGERVVGKGNKPRQSGDAAKGYTLQTRIEAPKEFGERLLVDIGERPEFYYQRQEIPRLEADLEEFREELWQVQQQIREAQRRGRHFRNTAQCTLLGRCEYLDSCKNGLDPENPPSGFERVETIHPELEPVDACTE